MTKRFRRTVVVIGPRGTGKTTLVKEALKEEKGVVFVPSCKTVEGVCKSLLTYFGVTNLKMQATFAFEHILRNANSNAVFVLDVDEEWSPEEVTSLMILAKRMGDMGTFVVVLSEALSFFSVMDRLSELRAVPFVLEEISREVKREYFHLIFDHHLDQRPDVEEGKKRKEKDELVEYTIQNAGISFLYLEDLFRDIKVQMEDENKSKFSPEEWKETVHLRKKKAVADMGEAFESLLDSMKVKKCNLAQKIFLTDLSIGKVFYMRDFYDCFGMEPQIFFELYKKIRPHPLHVSHGSRLCVNDPFAKIALQKIVESEHYF